MESVQTAGETATAGGSAAAAAEEQSPSVSARLAHLIAQAGRDDAIGAATRHHAVRALVNGSASALAGLENPEAGPLLEWARRRSAPSDAVRALWAGYELSQDDAALFNAALIHFADFDDTYIPTVLHPTAPVFGALFALAQAARVSGKRFLDAYVLGVEAATIVSLMLNPSHSARGFHVTASAGAIGAAVAAAVLRGLSEPELESAIALAAHRADGLKEVFGSPAKALGPGVAANAGLICADLASAGMTTAATLFEGRSGLIRATTDYEPSHAFEPLPEFANPWHVEQLALKRLPTGVAMHAPIDATLALHEAMTADQRAAITGLTLAVMPFVEQHWRNATGLQQDGKPLETGLQAKFSLKFVVSAAWAAGRFDLNSMDPKVYSDPSIAEFMRHIELVANPDAPTMDSCTATAHLAAGGDISSTIDFHKGSPGNPLSDEELSGKLRMVAERQGLEQRAEVALQALWTLADADDTAALAGALQTMRDREE